MTLEITYKGISFEVEIEITDYQAPGIEQEGILFSIDLISVTLAYSTIEIIDFLDDSTIEAMEAEALLTLIDEKTNSQ